MAVIYFFSLLLFQDCCDSTDSYERNTLTAYAIAIQQEFTVCNFLLAVVIKINEIVECY